MIGIIAIPLGLIAVALTLALARGERAHVTDTGRVADPAGDALATILAWISFAGLAVSALTVFGLVQGAILIVFPLVLGRMTPVSPGLIKAFPFKLRIAWAAVVLAIIALFGVVSLYSEVLSNG